MNVEISSKVLLINLLKAKVEEDDFDISDPVKTTGEFNTSIKIVPKLKSGFYGNFTFNYNRIVLDNINTINIAKGYDTTAHELINKITDAGISVSINDTYNQNLYVSKLSIDDIDNFIIPEIENNTSLITEIITTNKSLIFTGKLKINIVP